MTERSMIADAQITAGAADQLTLTEDHDQLQLSIDIGSDSVVVSLRGELDPHTAPLLQRQADEILGRGASSVVLDMSELRFIDSSGLRVVIGLQRRLQENGGSLALRSPSDTARRLFEITGLVDHIGIVDAESAG